MWGIGHCAKKCRRNWTRANIPRVSIFWSLTRGVLNECAKARTIHHIIASSLGVSSVTWHLAGRAIWNPSQDTRNASSPCYVPVAAVREVPTVCAVSVHDNQFLRLLPSLLQKSWSSQWLTWHSVGWVGKNASLSIATLRSILRWKSISAQRAEKLAFKCLNLFS
jgi:hypothetical protein